MENVPSPDEVGVIRRREVGDNESGRFLDEPILVP